MKGYLCRLDLLMSLSKLVFTSRITCSYQVLTETALKAMDLLVGCQQLQNISFSSFQNILTTVDKVKHHKSVLFITLIRGSQILKIGAHMS